MGDEREGWEMGDGRQEEDAGMDGRCVDLKNQIKKNKNASWKTQIHVREKRG